jgi:hypothetical protein
MQASPATSPVTPVYLALELLPARGAMTGSLYDETGTEHRFAGWLGLLTLLEAARARAGLDDEGA